MAIHQFKVGDKVHYKGFYQTENGIVKTVKPAIKNHVWVVYKCDGQWSRYQEYTGHATAISDLEEGWLLVMSLTSEVTEVKQAPVDYEIYIRWNLYGIRSGGKALLSEMENLIKEAYDALKKGVGESIDGKIEVKEEVVTMDRLVKRLDRIAKKNDDTFEYEIMVANRHDRLLYTFVCKETADGHSLLSGMGPTVDDAAREAWDFIGSACEEWGYEVVK